MNKLVACLALFLLFSLPLFSVTYYIDFAGGDDTAAGTAEGTAWKTIPGTRNTGGGGWQSTDWGSGTFNSGSKVPAGTIFRLKPGTTHGSANGGQIRFTEDFYATNASADSPISFIAYQAWAAASGTVTFDGSGVTLGGTGWGLIHCDNGDDINGVVWDGSITDGITIQDSTYEGISIYDNSDILEDWAFKNLKFYNNGTARSGDQASSGNLKILQMDGLVIENINIDGNGRAINGMYLGEDGRRVIDTTITNVVAHDFSGSDDGGIGLKSQNSQITYTNCTAYDGFKGMDNGEQSSTSAWDITIKIINCLFYSNTDVGLSGSCKGASRTGDYTVYIINTIIRDNGPGENRGGLNYYAGPFTLYVVHCVLDNNGGNAGYNINVTPDGSDTQDINIFLYNNIFYKPAGSFNFLNKRWDKDSSQMDIDSDYNCWRQRAAEDFARWDYFNVTEPEAFTYAEGPGGAGNNWYDYYDYNATPPSNSALGHYHADANSVVTEPSFKDVGNHDYTLAGTLPGTDISGKAWYIATMGIDRSGVARSIWDMGVYESSSPKIGPVVSIFAQIQIMPIFWALYSIFAYVVIRLINKV